MGRAMVQNYLTAERRNPAFGWAGSLAADAPRRTTTGTGTTVAISSPIHMVHTFVVPVLYSLAAAVCTRPPERACRPSLLVRSLGLSKRDFRFTVIIVY
jgi:hypothetical protein